MTQLEQIKAEIGRRFEDKKVQYGNTPIGNVTAHYLKGETDALESLLSFIESLEKEEAREVTSRHKQTLGCRGLSQVVEDKDTNNTIILQPQGLDEAAEEYAWKKEEPLADGERLSCAFNPRIDAFKAGAEWMAGQGVSMLGKVGIYGVDVESITEKLRKAGFKLGDKVIVQIRKK